MKKASVMTGFLALALTAACGSQSSKDQDAAKDANVSAAPAPQAIFASPAQQEEAAQEDNMMDCKKLTSTSLICSYNPATQLISEESGSPTLVTVKYTLKCDTTQDESLSNIAIRTDTQVRRLQTNVVDREVTILSREGAVVELAKVVKNDEVEKLEGASSCWYFDAKVVKTELISSIPDAGSSL
ncbi:MAG TPA: hypothetical protein VFO10_21515 [Oligoflexus sp.]|uniref:hypothetical protein n=1 Tax=Oligoflexus sp. TaxID=1971216 RepID=UPI002D7FBECC|nr:hypothetical protein [Oligoflexus sp.]HET9239854.1 hypothetical protein [Oligoflexus sp.]